MRGEGEGEKKWGKIEIKERLAPSGEDEK